ncbi:MAG: hypothetical protein NT062_28425 [Proteobacteria bacterium]|nr:hypothetical protein [Pseudomonadota bacterium]
MSTLSVFVEGAVDTAPGAVDRLAAAMASRYGLPAAELVQRLARGRFRVKANVDRATADVFVTDLEALGARVVVEESRPTQPSLQVPNIPAGSSLPAMPRTVTPPPQYQSGLAAAFTPAAPDTRMDLGALGGDGSAFTLSSIDGNEPAPIAVAPPRVTIRTPPHGVVIPPEPAFAPATVDEEPAPNTSDLMFAPPDAEDAQLSVDIAPDELDYRSRKTSLPPATVPVEPPARRNEPSIPPLTLAPEPAPGVPREPRAPRDPISLRLAPRIRLVLGVSIAILLGFIPAHLVGRARERSAYAEIDHRIVERQKLATTATEIEDLDGYRTGELAAKRSARNNIALVSMLLWAAVGGGLGYVWFRRLPWDRTA